MAFSDEYDDEPELSLGEQILEAVEEYGECMAYLGRQSRDPTVGQVTKTDKALDKVRKLVNKLTRSDE